MSADGEVTKLLQSWREGNSAALDALTPLVYRELHKIAVSHMKREKAAHTLSPTALVNETFLKLMQSDSPPNWQDRKHFFVVAAGAMRRLLVDHARAKRTSKRGGDPILEPIPDSLAAAAPPFDLIDLDRALARLAHDDARRAQMLELRYFGGLDLTEIAALLDISVATVSRQLRLTEAWLTREMRGSPATEQ